MMLLVVEDEWLIARELELSLIRCGYNADIVSNGADALTYVSQKTYDCILMDLQLSTGMNGIETAMELNKNYDIPVIFITGHSDPDT